MLNEVYNRRILELAGGIPRLGRLEKPDATATAHSKLCGSTVTVDLKMDGDTVTDFAHEVKACALGQASSSIMASHVVGAKAEELRKLRETVRKMLKENGEPPKDGKWADIAVLEPVRDYKARHASTLLTFDAVVSALDRVAPTVLTRNDDEANDLWGLVFESARLDEIVEQSVRTLELSVVAKYAFGLAQAFNGFYHKYSILNEEREEARVWRAAAVAYYSAQLARTLDLMGCGVPPKM